MVVAPELLEQILFCDPKALMKHLSLFPSSYLSPMMQRLRALQTHLTLTQLEEVIALQTSNEKDMTLSLYNAIFWAKPAINLSYTEIFKLDQMIQTSTASLTIQLSSTDDFANIKTLGLYLTSLPYQVQSLTIHGSGADNFLSRAMYLVNALEHKPDHLDISEESIVEPLADVSSLIVQVAFVKSLRLKNINLTDQAANELIKAIASSNLVELHLDECPAISKALIHCFPPSLRSLTLWRTSLEKDDFEALTQLLVHSQLEEFNFWLRSIEDINWSTLWFAIGCMSKLKSLGFIEPITFCDFSILDHIALAVKRLQLERFALYPSIFGSACRQRILDVLVNSQTHLHCLEWPEVVPVQDIGLLQNALVSNPELKTVHFHVNSIQDSFEALGHVLRQVHSVQNIRVDSEKEPKIKQQQCDNITIAL